MKAVNVSVLFVLVLVAPGCHIARSPNPDGSMSALYGAPPLTVRQEYVNSHPDLLPSEREGVLRGYSSIETTEVFRARRVSEAEDSARRAKDYAEETARLYAARAAEGQARTNYADQHTGLPAGTRVAILNRQILIGMTQEQVEISWGKPSTASRTINALGTAERWTYPSSVLYFMDGRLTSLDQTIK